MFFVYFFVFFVLKDIHGEDGGHIIDRSNEYPYLTDPYCQQQSPGGLTIRLPTTEDLRQNKGQSDTAQKYKYNLTFDWQMWALGPKQAHLLCE